MTSLDFKALLAKERAALRQGAGSVSGSSKGGSNKRDEAAELLLGARVPLDWAGHEVAGAVEGVTYVPGWLTEEEAANLLAAIDGVRACL